MKVVPDLIDWLDFIETGILSTDKGYASEPLGPKIKNTQTQANIPKKSNSKSSNEHIDWYLYGIRYLFKKIFARLKQFRGIATR